MLTQFLDKYAAPDWRNAHKMWSIWLAAAIAVLNGLILVVPAFIGYMNPYKLAGWSVGLALLLMFARLVKQRGVSDGRTDEQ